MSSRRQELYDRIRATSKDEVIIEEMIRLGFWPASSGKPDDPADEIRRRGELERRLRALRTESARLRNIDALKREARKRRMAESRRKRQETKERRLRERVERAEAWKVQKSREIIYLGQGVSAGLGHEDGDRPKLERAGLPVIFTAAELAQAMALSIGELRFLAFSRPASRTSHYVRFTIPKRTGGERTISAPMPRLKQAQQWILHNVLRGPKADDAHNVDDAEPTVDNVHGVHDAAHGFRPGCSIVTNAMPHVRQDVVVNVDLENFFPTVTYRRVKGLFRHIGYSEAVATILGLLCTEPEIAETELDGATYYVAVGQRFLPQGAPTSPAITNFLCRRLDRRLSKASGKLGFAYTRYADDLSFSGSGPARDHVGRLLRQVRWVVEQEGFRLHPQKTRVFGKGRRQEVTGIVVNERPAISRQVLRRFRAVLFHIEKDGPQGKHWGTGGDERGDEHGDVISSVLGFASYVAMVDPEKGHKLLTRAKALAAKHGRKRPPRDRAQQSQDPRRAPQASSPAPQVDSPVPTSRDPDEPAPSGGDKSGDDKGGDGGGKKQKKWWKLF